MLNVIGTWILVILLNVQISVTADVKDTGLLEPRRECGLSGFLHYVIKHEGSIRDLEIQSEKQEKKHADDWKKCAEDLKRLEKKQSEDQKKHAEDLKRLESKQAEDIFKMKSQLENKCKEDMDKMVRKHDEDIKQLKSDLEAPSKVPLSYKEPCPPALPFRWCGHCYGLIYINLTYHEAQRHCRSFGADLVWIEDSTEQNFVEATFSHRNEYAWIGCNDLIHEGKFRWSHNNQLVTYSKWHPGQPDSHGNEDCCMLVRNGTWNDLRCYRPIESFICKK